MERDVQSLPGVMRPVPDDSGFSAVAQGLDTLDQLVAGHARASEVAGALGRLRNRVHEHYRRERASWLHADGSLLCPRFSDQIKRLEQEQRSVERMLAHLYSECIESARPLPDGVSDRVATLIRRHERIEAELLQRALYEDLGGSG